MQYQLPSEPWLTPVLAMSLKMFEKTYGKLPGLGGDFKFNSLGIPYVPLRKADWKNTVLHSLLQAQLLLLLLGLRKLIFVTRKFSGPDLVEIVIVTLALVFIFTMLNIRRNIIRSGRLYAIGLNLIFQSGSTTHRRNKLANNKISTIFNDIPGLLLFYYMLGVITLGPPMPFVLNYLKIDVYTTTFSRLDIESNIVTQILAFLLLMFTMFYVVIHDLSAVLLAGVFSYLAIQSYLKAFLKLGREARNTHKVLGYYIQLRLIYNLYAKYFHNGIFSMIVFSQISITIFLWITINGFKVVPKFVVITFGLSFFGGVGLVMFLMRIFVNTRALSWELLKQAGRSKKCLVNRRRPREELLSEEIVKRQWISQPELPIKCGKLFAFSKDAIRNYMNVLSNNLTNSLILLKV